MLFYNPTDILPPLVENCPVNKTHFTSKRTEPVSWNQPNFTDPRGGELHLTSNQHNNSADLPWGDHFIHYTVTRKSNAKRSECLAAVSVLRKHLRAQ